MYAHRTSLKTFANSPVKVFFSVVSFKYKFQDITILDCVVSYKSLSFTAVTEKH